MSEAEHWFGVANYLHGPVSRPFWTSANGTAVAERKALP